MKIFPELSIHGNIKYYAFSLEDCATAAQFLVPLWKPSFEKLTLQFMLQTSTCKVVQFNKKSCDGAVAIKRNSPVQLQTLTSCLGQLQTGWWIRWLQEQDLGGSGVAPKHVLSCADVCSAITSWSWADQQFWASPIISVKIR